MSSRRALLALLALPGGCGPLWDADTSPQDAVADAGPGLTWREAERISSGNAPVSDVVVAIALVDGAATAVWAQGGPAEEHLWTSRHCQADGWGDPVRIDPLESDGAAVPRVAVDGAGAVHVVWQQTSGSYQSIRASVRLPDEGWAAPTVLAGDGMTHATAPRIAVTLGGAAIAVWHRTDNVMLTEVWSAAYQPELGWQPAERIDVSGGAQGPDVAIDEGGTATAVWSAGDGVWARRWTSDSGWQGAVRIRASSEAVLPLVSVDGNWDATVVWMDGLSIRAARHTLAGWQAPSLIASDGGAGAATNPDLGVRADNGVATVAWQDDAGQILARGFEPGADWGATVVIDDGGGLLPRIGDHGAPVVVWTRLAAGGRGRIYASTFDGTWAAPSQLDLDVGSAQQAEVASIGAPYAVAAWTVLDEGRGSVWAAVHR